MPLLRLVLVVSCVLSPLRGFAQAPEPGAEAATPVQAPPIVPAPAEPEASPPADAPTAPKGEIIPREYPAQQAPSSAAPRIVLEVLGSLVGTTLGILPGVLVIRGISPNASSDETLGSAVLAIGMIAVGAPLGMALGISVGGDLMGGQGEFFPTLGGVVLGALAGSAASLVAVIFPPLAALAFIGPFVGGIYFYERSHASAVQYAAFQKPRVAQSGVRVMPLLSAAPGGGLFGGLVGSF